MEAEREDGGDAGGREEHDNWGRKERMLFFSLSLNGCAEKEGGTGEAKLGLIFEQKKQKLP